MRTEFCSCVLLLTLGPALCQAQAAYPLFEQWMAETANKPIQRPLAPGQREEQDPVFPVILVPGYMGSQLEYTVDRDSSSSLFCPRSTNGQLQTLWLTLSNHSPLRVNCWIQNARMAYDESTRTSSNGPGVTVQVKDFGGTTGIEFVSPMPEQHPETAYFYNLIRALEAIGYQRGSSVRGAPYDWRRAYHENDEFQTGFKDLIERTSSDNSNKTVVVLCHSMGCTFTYTFLQSMPAEWKDRFIKSWIVIGAPLGGTFKYMYGYFADDDYPVVPGVRSVERTLSSHAFLLPRAATYGDEQLVQSSTRTYSARQYDAFFRDLNMSGTAYNMFLDTKDIYEDSSLRSPGDFPVVCMGGVGHATLEKALIAGDLRPGARWTAVYGDGDQFVNTKSMKRCMDFGIGNENFQYREFRLDHMSLIKGPEPISFLMSLLNGYNGRRYRAKSTLPIWPFPFMPRSH